ncbi:protein crumbs homolog 1-like [Mytilus californianus]|uniref:protein crumbs homolog 1-like n=1 Tax=Mytilus californianus TaxID=6549 RepID=UPI002247747B|nr:protein crumbs homolog 1-like [Mytilus californianus]
MASTPLKHGKVEHRTIFKLVYNECKTSPCGNDNICISEQNGYSCQCLSGYSGANCDIPPNFCKVNGCKNNATCVSNFANYSCVCDSNCTGTFCETQIVHGKWGSWLGWSECSQSCNGGTQYRARYCDDPAPELYGLECSGTNMSSQACNTDLCPVCLSHSTIYSYKNRFNCTSISDSTSCVVTCQDGYSFVRDYQPLDQYECGPQTGHIWNAIPPPCARSDSPRAVRATAAVTYK